MKFLLDVCAASRAMYATLVDLGRDVFLRLNGLFIDCDSLEAHAHFMHLFDTHSFHFAELADWLKGHVKPLAG